MNVNELEDASSSSPNTTSHSSPNHRPPPLDDKRSNKSTTTTNNNTAGTGCIGCGGGGGGGWEVFIWGGPERGNGENEPIYAEELRGVGICQIALTSSSSNNNNDGTTTGTTTNNNNTNTANLNLTQNNNDDNNNNNDDDVVDHDHQVDPRHCATAIVLTNDQEILEWGPSSHWNKVPHRSRRLHSLSSSSSLNPFGATFKASESRKGTDSSSSTDFTTAGTAATTTTTREIIQIQSGLDHFAAVTNQGHLYTWGNPSCGKLGHHNNNNNNAGSMMTTSSTTTRTILPKRVLQGLDPNIPIRQVACGDEHTLALTITGQVYSWGRRDIAGHNVMYRMGSSNALGGGGLGGGIGEGGGAGGAMRGLMDGVLAGGDLQLTPRLLHIPAATPTNNNDDENNYDNGQEDDRIIVGVQIAACAKHSAIVTDDGTLYTWGKDNHGQLGHGDKRIYLQPKLVESIVNVVITTTTNNNRRNHNNRNNSQRTTNINNRNMSQQQHQQWNIQTCLVSSQTIHISKVSCGTYHMAIVTEQGKLYTFGNNKGGQLGSGNKEEQCYPTLVPYFMGGSSSSTSTTNNNINNNNNTGNQSTTPRHNHHHQQQQPQHHNIFQVACGKYHTAALTQKGDVYTWGYGYNGQLGHGSYLETLVPQKVEKLNGYHIDHVAADGLYTWVLVNPSSLAADDVSFASCLRSMVNNEEFADVEFDVVADDDDDDEVDNEDDYYYNNYSRHNNKNANNHEDDDNTQDDELGRHHQDDDTDRCPQGRGRGRRRRERIYAHRAILIQRSHYFRSMFRSGMRESTERVIPISSDIRKSIFLLLLEYIYTNTVLSGVPVEAAFELWELAEMHGLKKLQGMCCASVKCNLNVENAAPMLQMAAAAAATSSSSSSSSLNRLRSRRDIANYNDHDDDDDDDEDDDDDHPKNRLKDICMQFVVQNFASVTQTQGLQQITNLELCHEIMIQVADSYCP